MTDAIVATHKAELRAPSLEEMGKTCEKLETSAPNDVRTLACLLSQMNLRYYADVLSQAKQSFLFALVAAAAGFLLFAGAAWTIYIRGGSAAWINLSAGALLEVISGTCFYLYRKASSQFATFHICLDRSNRFILANMLCENLCSPKKDETREYLVHVIAEATLLTPDVVSEESLKIRKNIDWQRFSNAASESSNSHDGENQL